MKNSVFSNLCNNVFSQLLIISNHITTVKHGASDGIRTRGPQNHNLML
ncbi:hypothetical protein rpr22_0731 [Rickettsia prowazekii str. Rp22]|uniref:Uncharacterized protein n=1 Tax=Rickettsia prowazekii (strain Rp22) TaxID=449216 RepID=D5AXV4_RICPP|nr:hypothetical protein rpr22_0731 [Rickettsia prowazekii str. Rp22]